MKTVLAVRWGIALVVAAIVYVVVIRVVPMVEGNVKAISPTVLELNTSLLATAAGLIAGAFAAPRIHISLARRYFFILGMLLPIGRAAWDFTHGGAFHHSYLLMLAGAFAGGMLGLFVMILPKPPRRAQPRRFG